MYFGILNLVGDGGLRGSAGRGAGRDSLYPPLEVATPGEIDPLNRIPVCFLE